MFDFFLFRIYSMTFLHIMQMITCNVNARDIPNGQNTCMFDESRLGERWSDGLTDRQP